MATSGVLEFQVCGYYLLLLSCCLTFTCADLLIDGAGEIAPAILQPATFSTGKVWPQAPRTHINRKLRASTPLCSKADISITQGKSGDSNGIPAFSVQIVNLCVNSNCQLRNIHIACEAFASARPLDSRVFQRVKYNDCLVMGGAPLRAGGSVAFEYANSSEYPMHVISADLGPCT